MKLLATRPFALGLPIVWTAILCLSQRAAAEAKDVRIELKNYEIRLVRVGNTFQGIRFRPATGEAWQIVVDKWESIRESDAAPLPSGDYDVVLVAGENDLTAFRFDHVTGATWILQGRKWVRVREAKE
ncbi:MAG: hypothetical protein KatS3mg105_1359 [Gemmatales bacterium]|nr:MAG: hypothetical protein KatS3mg105_1359 [Gemmatales bacterium]